MENNTENDHLDLPEFKNLAFEVFKSATELGNREEKEFRTEGGFCFCFGVVLISILALTISKESDIKLAVSIIAILISIAEVALLIIVIIPTKYKIIDIENIVKEECGGITFTTEFFKKNEEKEKLKNFFRHIYPL